MTSSSSVASLQSITVLRSRYLYLFFSTVLCGLSQSYVTGLARPYVYLSLPYWLPTDKQNA